MVSEGAERGCHHVLREPERAGLEYLRPVMRQALAAFRAPEREAFPRAGRRSIEMPVRCAERDDLAGQVGAETGARGLLPTLGIGWIV